ncbi:N-acetyltransferase family protein [Paenarthrobacter aurescens]|uniref:N-acetyltransferase n=2 Tax=Paenarthrobacter aurescens TaxID=43663 RepID=A0A4Y3NA73_PAEAU|nr:GNAT family N-acetyltransferase [Paenarthrobacter aurescens]MDO6145050.1 N-acetyltransferase family protein [Paenarthrobacter aurescens]MDO6148895.1 N-acetyltransferase family protein [Paenarthrobacter aurescens]MDO6160141.1 N-acetyltransferase family protein [Paenarthrobacter aurescens]MDO6164000.1 N-acetyltransferase family protein [Paenarthrobacter aurescens]GEB17285.1 N-acetyltransferase [Paenarthrobacter aurescens]
MVPEDWPTAREIFQEGIDTGFATFEAAAPEWASFNSSKLTDHRLVAVNSEGIVLGWTAVSPVSARPAYSGVVEHSIYVAAHARGQGIGGRLLDALSASTEEKGIWTIQSSIFPENEASLRLHLAHGFAVVGRRDRIARVSTGPAAGQWRDTLLLERRSPVIG